MAMINRVSQLFKADFHAVLDQIEEPELLLKQSIRDMEDELAATEQQIVFFTSDQEALVVRISELADSIVEIDTQLDLCFDSGKDDLAKSLIRKKLETGRLLKQIESKHAADEKILTAKRTSVAENHSILEGLRQKAELIAQKTPSHAGAAGDGSLMWSPGKLSVDDDEVEVAYLREKSRRSTS